MNRRGTKPRKQLALCANCGMDSGVRKTIDRADERYLVICETCGAHTKACRSMSAASNAWDRGDVIKKKARS